MGLCATLVASCASPVVVRGWRSSPAAAVAASAAAHSLVQGDYANALERADGGLKGDPGDPWLLYQRGSALAGLGRLDEALESLVLAEARFPTPHERALVVYRRGLILEAWRRCSEASTEFSHFAFLLHEVSAQLSSEALAHLQSCVSPEEERTVPEEHRSSADTTYTAAFRYLLAGDYPHTLIEAQVGLAFSPFDARLAYIRAAAFTGLGRSDDAVEAFRVAARLFNRKERAEAIAMYRMVSGLEDGGDCNKSASSLHGRHLESHVQLCRAAANRRRGT